MQQYEQHCKNSVSHSHKFSSLGEEETELFYKLDGIFKSWGVQFGAEPMVLPLLLPVNFLSKLDVYNNFPQQAVVATSLDLQRLDTKIDCVTNIDHFALTHMEPAELALPAAACYAVYMHFIDQKLPSSGKLITVLGNCCRRESYYESFNRLLGFHMREIVALGSQEFAEKNLSRLTIKITEFAQAIKLPLRKQKATDPFYDQNSSRLLMQKISPVKHEFLFENLAIASLNSHRNFFGERCSITLDGSDAPIFTSCVGFGLERWLAVLYKHCGSFRKA